MSEQEERLALTFALGLLLEEKGVARAEFSGRELRWGLSGRQVNTFLSAEGDLTLWLSEVTELVPGAAAMCPWPEDSRGSR
jgi:hypothetical protein